MSNNLSVEFNAALWAATQAIPMVSDSEINRQRIGDYENGYNAGRKKALEDCANVIRSLERKAK